MATDHLVVSSTPETVRWGRLPSAAARPVGTVADGGVITFETVSHEGLMPDQGLDPVGFFSSLGVDPATIPDDARALAAARLPRDHRRDGPHIVTGPVAVRGARAGDLLRVEIVALERRTDFGIISNRHGYGVLTEEFPRPRATGEVPDVVSHLALVDPNGEGVLRDRVGRTIRFPLGEFLGLIGVAPATDTEPSSTPPGPYGGNTDVRHTGVGASWLLPVQVDEALLYAGDPHFAQGNGEIALTALEAPLRATVRVSLERDAFARRVAAAIEHPFIETAEHYIAIGLGTTLDDALAACARHALVLVVERTGLDPAAALAYLSAASDFEISQAVNGVRGVHCRIRRRDLDSIV
jgi:acetamidase/formamidase